MLVVVVLVLGVLVAVVQVVHVAVVLDRLVPAVLPVGVLFLGVLGLVPVIGHDRPLSGLVGAPEERALPLHYAHKHIAIR